MTTPRKPPPPLPVWTHYTEIVASRGEGNLLYDQDGRATWISPAGSA
jgi:hypothetical protein